MDQRLVEGVTYIYQMMQTQILQVKVFSATRMIVLLVSSTHSSRELKILL